MTAGRIGAVGTATVRCGLWASSLAHVWGEIAFCWPGAEWISSVFRGLLSKQPQIS